MMMLTRADGALIGSARLMVKGPVLAWEAPGTRARFHTAIPLDLLDRGGAYWHKMMLISSL